ncbi:hypothetical protein HY497_01700 [Candidatus Woesearchaeota archaeon]|nr:hypothetical protein [Candidatus Woesearchaeota archaeon]
MRNNPDTGFVTGTVEEKTGNAKSTDLRSVKIRVREFEDEVEETWRENQLARELPPEKIVEVYMNPRYGGRYDELKVGNEVRVHVALISALNGNYLIGDGTEIKKGNHTAPH